MGSIKFELQFEKKSAKLNASALKIFVTETIKNFGGVSLISNCSIKTFEDNQIEINTDKDGEARVCAALIMCGRYNEIKCCFRILN